MRKGYQYMTVVLDLDTGAVLYTALGKDQQALAGFFARLRRARAKLEAIAVDMSPAYARAIKAYWPGAVAIVHDHYHVVSNMNEVIDPGGDTDSGRAELPRSQFVFVQASFRHDWELAMHTAMHTYLRATIGPRPARPVPTIRTRCPTPRPPCDAPPPLDRRWGRSRC